MGRNVNIGLSSSELLRLYTQVSKTPLGASATATASFDPLTFGSLTSQSIYSSSPSAFISASRASFNFINNVNKSGSDLQVYTASPYTSSTDMREFRYIVWDTTNEIFYEFTQPTIEYILSTAAREARYPSWTPSNDVTYTNSYTPQQQFIVSTSLDLRLQRYPSPVYTNYVRPETYLLKIPINSTIEQFIEFLDSTFQNDLQASPISSSLAASYTTKLTLTGSVVGGGWNDTSASAAGVPINGLYYTSGSVIRVRLN